jgi:hypothetical protein
LLKLFRRWITGDVSFKRPNELPASDKIIDMARWKANSYILDGRRRQINDMNIRRAKVKAALSGGRPGGR